MLFVRNRYGASWLEKIADALIGGLGLGIAAGLLWIFMFATMQANPLKAWDGSERAYNICCESKEIYSELGQLTREAIRLRDCAICDDDSMRVVYDRVGDLMDGLVWNSYWVSESEWKKYGLPDMWDFRSKHWNHIYKFGKNKK